MYWQHLGWLGCIEPGNRDVIVAKNDSPERQDVEVFYLPDGEEELLVRVAPGQFAGS